MHSRILLSHSKLLMIRSHPQPLKTGKEQHYEQIPFHYPAFE